MRFALLLSVVSCVAVTPAADLEDPDVGAADDPAAPACGSALGDAVAAAARANPSTVTRADWRRNRVVRGPLVEGREIGDALYDLVRSAQHEVLIEFFVIEDSWIASRLHDAIAQLPASVHVYVMTNPHGGFDYGGGLLGESASQAASRVRGLLPFPNVTVGGWQASDWLGLNAMHTKSVVVDGARALIVDANLQKLADPVDQPGGLGWFQMGVVIEGNLVSSLREEAASAWRRATPSATLPAAPAQAPVADCTHMTVLGRDAGAGENASADRAYAALFTHAHDRVRAISPNLNDDGALAALAQATANADIELMLSKGFNDSTESLPGQGGTNVHNVDRLAGMAANKCRLHIRWFARDSGVAIDGNGTGASHSKWASADGTTMIIGSQNLDTQSWKHSRELSIAIDDAATTAAFDAVFDGLWQDGASAFECGG